MYEGQKVGEFLVEATSFQYKENYEREGSLEVSGNLGKNQSKPERFSTPISADKWFGEEFR